MTKRTITKAVKHEIPARVAIAGPSGSGKTWTGLEVATELGGKLLVIDTERRSASLYADHFDFEVINWEPPYDPRELANTIAEVAPNYEVVLVDSGSHFWMGPGGTLDMVDTAKAKSKSHNSFDAWRVGTPAQNSMVDAMLAAPCHVIFTMRSKTEYVQERNAEGKTVIRKVGMAPIQRDGIEFEFTVTVDLDHDHNAVVTKTRCTDLADQVFRPGESRKWARTLREWLASGEPPPPPERNPAPAPQEGGAPSTDTPSSAAADSGQQTLDSAGDGGGESAAPNAGACELCGATRAQTVNVRGTVRCAIAHDCKKRQEAKATA